MKVVIAVDANEFGPSVLENSLQMFDSDNHNLTIVHIREHGETKNEEVLLQKMLRHGGENITGDVDVEILSSGNVSGINEIGRVLVEYCTEKNADLLVTGRTKRGTLGKIFFGSCPESAMTEKEVPVLVIPENVN